MSGDKPWKRAERTVANFFGTRRRPLSGGNQGEGYRDDTMHPDLHIEVKYSRVQPIMKLFRDTKAKADKEGKHPVIGLVEKGAKGFLLVVHSNNLKAVLRALLEARKNGKLKPKDQDSGG
jgi:hypothetical protein